MIWHRKGTAMVVLIDAHLLFGEEPRTVGNFCEKNEECIGQDFSLANVNVLTESRRAGRRAGQNLLTGGLGGGGQLL